MQTRRRFKQALSLQDRLTAFAADVRNQASALPPGPKKDDLLRRARIAETTAHLDDWVNSPGLQPPK